MDAHEIKPCVKDNFLKSVINNVEVVHHGNWLDTLAINYTDPLGNSRQWEAVSCTTKPKRQDAVDSVEVIALLKRNLHHNCIVLVKQFRPPLGCYSIELPAGLCDESDLNVEASALRELYEETGYMGKVTKMAKNYQPTSLDPSTQSSCISNVHILIDGDDPKNIDCAQHLDEGEFVEVLLVPVRNLLHRLNELVTRAPEKTIIDSRLYALATGLEMGLTLTTKCKPLEDESTLQSST
ncbi:ADP-sugar pyrophosphatase-like [Clavelina lepadiformis]|uniref:ADP-sugar pyrophosphatase-like n=1 Tax=Clavelina lepadiformis TaxID=159417 RepID=UPI004043826F